MAKLLSSLRNLVRGEEGVSLVEYAVTLLLILIVTIAALAAFGLTFADLFGSTASSI
jgi:Flp pilus assembly pilin Flp